MNFIFIFMNEILCILETIFEIIEWNHSKSLKREKIPQKLEIYFKMNICITLLHGPANHSPLHSSSAVQFFVSLNLLARSHFSSGTFVTVSPSNVPQNTLRVCTPDPHFAEHYGTKVIVCQMSRERIKYDKTFS